MSTVSIIEAEKRIQELREILTDWNYNYFTLNSEIFPETQRDQLKKELIELEKQFPQFYDSKSPTQIIGSQLSDKFAKILHKTAKLSLDDVFSYDELKKWHKKISKLLPENEHISFFVEPKIDGLNVTIWYEDGVLVKALTRGDGQIGEDITHTIATINALPKKLLHPYSLELTGEVFINKQDFNKLNTETASYANPRNLAAGTVRQLDPQIAKNRNLQILLYGIGSNNLINPPTTQLALMSFLMSEHLPVSTEFQCCENLEQVNKYLQLIKTKQTEMPYEIDGGVIKVNSFSQQAVMGRTSRSPRFAVAYKFPAVEVETQILNITVQVGLQGALTPVAELKPVLVSGSVVSRATLHNEDEIQRKDIRINDYVVLRKAGEIIPEVVTVIKSKRDPDSVPYIFPTRCPICNLDTKKNDGQTIRRCVNIGCYAKEFERVKHFVSRKAMNIDGIGRSVIKNLIDSKLITDPADLYSLTVDNLLSLPLFQERKAEKVIKAIQNSKNIELHKFLYALAIRHVGEHTAKILTDIIPSNIQTVDKLLDFMSTITLEQLNSVNNLGDIMTTEIKSWFEDQQNIKLLNKFNQHKIIFIRKHAVDNKAAKYIFLFTGTLNNLSRIEAGEIAENKGAKVANSLNKTVTHLVCGDNPGSKLQKAKDLNITIINEQEFLDLMN